MNVDNVSEIFRHPSVVDSPTEELTQRIMESRLRQQLVINWVIGGVGVGVFLVMLGIAMVVWRFALTIET